MSWWNKHKKTLLLILLGFLGVGFLVIVGLMLLGPVIGDVFCTVADCIGDGVHINFIGNMPDSYTVEVGFPSGKRKIICNSVVSSDSYQFSGGDQCKPNGVFFEQIDSQKPSDLPPEELTVTISFDEKIITKTFRPEYEIWHVNGEDCEPMCYFATIEFDLSQ